MTILFPILFLACSHNPYNGETGAMDAEAYTEAYIEWLCEKDCNAVNDDYDCVEYLTSAMMWPSECVDSALADYCIDWMRDNPVQPPECGLPEECRDIFVPCP